MMRTPLRSLRLRKTVLLALGLLALPACVGQYEALFRSGDTDLKYRKAVAYFEAKKYTKALELFKDLEMVTRGTSRDDTLQYYYGLTNYYLNDFEAAQEVFKQFEQVYPRSPFAPRAVFMRLDCMYQATYRADLDQLPSKTTLAAIQEYLYNYPQNDYVAVCERMMDDLNERMDRKTLESAKLYFKIEDYKAAAYALSQALKDDPDNRYREEMLYYIVAAHYKFADLSIPEMQRERFLVVIDSYYNFISEFPESEYRRSVDNMYKRAQQFTRRHKVEGVTDGLEKEEGAEETAAPAQ